MGTKDRAEGAELEPPREQLAAARRSGIEAADVGAPVGHARQADIEAESDLGLERGEAGVDIARPAGGAEALHARPAGPAEQEGATLRAIPRFAVREGLLPPQVVAIVIGGIGGGAVAAIEPPAVDAIIMQRTVLFPPPVADLGPSQIEIALPLVIVGRRSLGRRHARIGLVEQGAPVPGFDRERR